MPLALGWSSLQLSKRRRMLADARTARMDMLISKSVSLWKANFLALLGKLALRGRNSLGDRELLNLLARAAGHLFISLAQNHRSQMCGRQGACQSADIISVHSL